MRSVWTYKSGHQNDIKLNLGTWTVFQRHSERIKTRKSAKDCKWKSWELDWVNLKDPLFQVYPMNENQVGLASTTKCNGWYLDLWVDKRSVIAACVEREWTRSKHTTVRCCGTNTWSCCPPDCLALLTPLANKLFLCFLVSWSSCFLLKYLFVDHL